MIDWRPTTWHCYIMPTGSTITIDSADMIDWRPTIWRCYSMPTGSTITIDSADMIDWRPTTWHCYIMPTGSTITIDSADMIDWRPTTWRCYSMPTGSTFAFTVSDFAGWTECNDFRAQNNALTEAQVDTILNGLYQASIVPRTGTGGTINVGGTNAAPSGIYQAQCSPTTGKEFAYELLNDSCGLFNNWATVTTS
jgi:hypothetical protein